MGVMEWAIAVLFAVACYLFFSNVRLKRTALDYKQRWESEMDQLDFSTFHCLVDKHVMETDMDAFDESVKDKFVEFYLPRHTDWIRSHLQVVHRKLDDGYTEFKAVLYVPKGGGKQ